MRRSCVLRWGIVVCCGLIWGCGAPPRGNWFAQSAGDGAEPRRSTEKAADRNALQPAGTLRASNAEPAANPNAPHDAATTRFIEQELGDATPEEREELYQNLKQLDPFWVRQILRTRRQMITMRQKASQREQIAAGSARNEDRAVTARGTQNWPATNGSTQSGQAVRPVSGESSFPAQAQTTAANRFGPSGPTNQLHAPPPARQFRQAAYHLNQTNALQNPAAGFTPGDYRTPHNAAMQDPQLQQTAGSAYQTAAPTGTGGFGHGRQDPQNGAAVPSNPVQLGSGGLHSVPWGASPAPGQNAPYATAVPNQGNPAIALKSFGMQPRSLPATPANGFNANSTGNPQTAYPAAGPQTGQQAGWFGANQVQAVAGSTPQATQPGFPQPGGTTGFGGPLQASLPSGPSSQWDGELQRLISLAEAETARIGPGTTEAEKQDYIEKHVYLRWLYLIAGQQAKALEAIPGLEPADQEFWQQMFWAVANYFDSDAMPDNGDRASQTIAQLRSAIQRLQENARLDLRNVTFCHKISSFGDYERFKRDEFSPGQPVLIYAEIANFKSEPTADGQYRTLLRSTVEVYKAGPGGGLVKREDFPATEDLCRNHRKDYFHSYQIDIPQRITLGPHVMKLIVEDQLSRKVATYSLNFTVK